MLVAVASKNPVKVEAAELVFSSAFGDVSIRSSGAPPGLAPQPMSLDDTVRGAVARAAWACDEISDAAYCVGLESGIMKIDEVWYAITVAVVRARDGRSSMGLGPAYPLPRRIAEIILSEGLELEEAMDRLYSTRNLGEREGAVGIFSRGMSSRLELCAQAVKMALLPFMSPDDYS
ncbi:inosine/xanthosine triphosphatase [Conexivisphaera calida]|uniref:Probable inosine/xanthosine triphosphatase n=1 Tax=Conexivisphaera calida TaxID=1874277 RepID=A0A4P2VEW6_9ARCH|nr:inosine/xanthosine triphosphatase [Conexivisphaera calida]BBE42944.1 Inosine/xanthosine triphosphatase [Conexivisphaera calida]